MIWKIIMLLIILLLLDAGYILLIIASKAKERADKVTKLLKERQDLPSRRNPDGTFDVHYKPNRQFRSVRVDGNYKEIGKDDE